MAAVVAAVNTGQASGTAARTITYPTIGATDVCLTVISYGNATLTMTPPAGNNAVANRATGAAQIWAGWTYGATPTGNSYTVSATMRDTWATARISGAASSPINASGASAVVTGTSVTSPVLTTTVADTLILHLYTDFVTANGTAANFTTPASTTLDATLSTNLATNTVRWTGSLFVHDTAALAAAGATTGRAATAAAGSLVAMSIAIAPGAGGPPAVEAPRQGPRMTLQAVNRSVTY